MSDTQDVLSSAPAEPALDPADAIRALADENVAYVAQLRSTQIPQHVGMAAACRQLVADLPGLLIAQVEADLRTGALAKRWEAICTAAAEDAGVEGAELPVAAVAVLLREQSRAAVRYLAQRAKDWTAEAFRFEGQAVALEGQAERLRGLAAPAPREIASDHTEASG
jgi:hypothetical protein